MLISGAFFVATSATEGATVSTTNYRYEYINGSEVRITDYIGQGGAVVIPASLDGKPVREIGESAFSDNTRITSVVVPDSVRLIDDYAFAYSTAITSVTIGGSVSVIGNWTFFNCLSLTTASIPSSVSYIGGYAFAGCNAMTSINVSPSNPAYASMDGIMYDKANTTLIQCPSGKAGAVTIPDNVTSIGEYAFYSCGSVTSVTIPNSVISIDFEAFYYCTALTSVTIPANVTSLAYGVFYSCSSMTSFDVNASNPSFSSVDGVLYNKAATTLIQYPIGREGTFTIPNGVTTIGSTAFYNCMNLTSVTIPNGVTKIDSYAFQNCQGLASVTIPNSVTVIAYQSFYGCDALTSVTIPDSVVTIGGYVFAYCDSLTGVTIPASVISVGDMAFGYCLSLTSIDVNASNPNFVSIDGALYNKAATTLIAYPTQKLGGFTVPETVKVIKDRAFSNCVGLTSLIIGNNVTVIGNNTFSYCSALVTAKLSNSVSYIGNNAFYYCDKMNSLSLGTNVTTIGVQAFQSCSALTSVTISGKVASIGSQAFGSCRSLTAINVNASNPNFVSNDAVLYNKNMTTLIQCPGGKSGAFTIPSSVITIGNGAFSGCNLMTAITIPDSVASIGSGGFFGMTSLKQIDVSGGNPNYNSVNGVLYDEGIHTLIAFPSARTGSFIVPNSVTKIGASAFYLSNLTSAIIPSSVAEVEERAFTSTQYLTHLQFDGNAPICGRGWVSSDLAGLIVYYVNGASDFTSPTWFGVGTVAMFLVTGKVVDTNGKGMANLTVALESGASTMTDSNGNFSINASPGGHSITISGPGIDTKKVDAQVTGTGLVMGNITIGNNGTDLGLLILILIGVIAIILVLVFVAMKRRGGKSSTGMFTGSNRVPWQASENQPPKFESPPEPEPVQQLPIQPLTTSKKCPNCGSDASGTPFCGVCGKRLG
ncbi:MAG TPA: leucine-rich repeat protein [Methanomassiliicoccales archaeon]